MQTIASLDQYEMGLTAPTDYSISFTREAARAVVSSTDGKVAVMHFTATGAYKLPGGGIDEGEDHEAALRRELREEMGYTVTNVAELGIVKENRYYNGMHQTSYCYTATAEEFVGTELTKKEQQRGMNLQWADSLDQAIAWIKSGHTVDEDGSDIGLVMMQTRDIAILQAAKK